MENMVVASIFSGAVWQIIGNTSVFGKFILLALVTMSLVSWVIIFAKWRQFRAVEEANQRFIQTFRRSRTLGESVGQAKSQKLAPVSHIFLAGFSELGQLREIKNEAGGLQESIKPLDQHDYDILEMSMERVLTEQVAELRSRVIFLATTGSSAPFMGLLGTVVGIMDSFWSIGERGSASLAVVAPGIAEALLATIIGLGAAIPAVIAYNWANNKMKFISDFSYNFILEFITRTKKEVR